MTAIILWIVVSVYGAISGWWLTPLARTGDARAFMDAAIAMSNTQSRGNIALVLMRNGVVFGEHFALSIDRIRSACVRPMAIRPRH